jgi:PilZ domain
MRDDKRSLDRPAGRKPVQMAVTLVIESDEAEYLATTVDLSLHGLRLQSEATLAPGQPVGLLLATEPACFIRARVAWVGRTDSAQAGQAGFQFLDPLTGPVC